MSKVKEWLRAAWDKVVAGVKSSPAVFGYGLVIGFISGWLVA